MRVDSQHREQERSRCRRTLRPKSFPRSLERVGGFFYFLMSWTEIDTYYFSNVVYGNGIYASVEFLGTATSLDGIDWLIPSTNLISPNAIAYGNEAAIG